MKRWDCTLEPSLPGPPSRAGPRPLPGESAGLEEPLGDLFEPVVTLRPRPLEAALDEGPESRLAPRVACGLLGLEHLAHARAFDQGRRRGFVIGRVVACRERPGTTRLRRFVIFLGEGSRHARSRNEGGAPKRL